MDLLIFYPSQLAICAEPQTDCRYAAGADPNPGIRNIQTRCTHKSSVIQAVYGWEQRSASGKAGTPLENCYGEYRPSELVFFNGRFEWCQHRQSLFIVRGHRKMGNVFCHGFGVAMHTTVPPLFDIGRGVKRQRNLHPIIFLNGSRFYLLFLNLGGFFLLGYGFGRRAIAFQQPQVPQLLGKANAGQLGLGLVDDHLVRIHQGVE